VALSPVPIIAVMLMLTNRRARVNAVIMSVLCLVIGVKLIGDAIGALAG
jgi:hypothetical protein